MPAPLQPGLQNNALRQSSQQTAQHQQQVVSQQGAYRGEKVRTINLSSLIDDAAEELTDSIEEDQEKDFASRDVEDGKKSKRAASMLRVKQVEKLMNNLQDLVKPHLVRALERLMAMQGASPKELIHEARQHFQEPAHQYAALFALTEGLKEQGAPVALIAAAEGALKMLLDEQGPAIRAGINVSATANEFSGAGLGDAQTLRDSYRDAVLDYQGVSQAFDELVKKYGDKELPKAIRYLLEALAADLGSGGASIDHKRLQLVIDDMYRLEVIAGLLQNSDKVLELLHKRGVRSRLSGANLLSEVIKLMQKKWLSPDQILALTGRVGVAGITPQIGFMRDFQGLVRLIPLKAYPDDKNRGQLMEAIQGALDDAAEQEDA